MKMTNKRNQLIYRLWAPVYDFLLERIFAPGRRRAAARLDLQPGERVLLVGAGTGGDLPLLPPGIDAVATDLSPDMLKKAQIKADRLTDREITIQEADALNLPFDDASFDTAILSLILSVVPDGTRCLQETCRVVRPGGRIVIFDKFAKDTTRINPARRLLNIFTTLAGTDITRSLAPMVDAAPCTVVTDEPGILNGAYRVVLLHRP